MPLKPLLRHLLADEHSVAKRRADIFLAALTVVSIGTYVLALSTVLPAWADEQLHVFDLVTIGVFALEYLSRFHIASDFIPDLRRKGLAAAVKAKIAFMLNPMSIIDLLALLPAMRVFRIARIFRLFRLLRLVRHTSTMSSVIDIFREHGFELATVFAFAMAVLVFSGTAMFLLENPQDHKETQFQSIGDAFWWAIVSMTTVGYGDKIPATGPGKILAGFVIFSGVLVIAFPTAIITSAFTEKLARMKEGRLQMQRMTGHIVVCGLSKSTDLIVREIQDAAQKTGRMAEVVVVASFAGPGVALPEEAVLQRGDVTRESTLRNAGVPEAQGIIIMAERRTQETPDETVDARSILCAMQCEALNKDAVIVAEILESENAKTLAARVPRAEIVESASLGPRLMALGTLFQGSAAVITDLLSPGRNDFCTLPVTDAVLAKASSFGDLFTLLRQRHAIPCAIRRGREMLTLPDDTEALRKGDLVLVMARDTALIAGL